MAESRKAPNILTVDVEDWYHILELGDSSARAGSGELESRVVANTERLLALFDEAGARATFFVVGWVAWEHPDLVRRIAAAGHELASHSFWHEVIGRHDRASLAADLAGSKKLLEDLGGVPVRGFRAPGASVTEQTAWAFDVIVEQGFAYDASLCPGYSSHGGFRSPYLGPHKVRCGAGELVELRGSGMARGASPKRGLRRNPVIGLAGDTARPLRSPTSPPCPIVARRAAVASAMPRPPPPTGGRG